MHFFVYVDNWGGCSNVYITYYFAKVSTKGVLPVKECKDSKNLGVLKTKNSGDFKTVNCIQIGQFLTVDGFVAILSLGKKIGYFRNNIGNYVFLRESLQNRQKSSDLYTVDGFKIARIFGFQNAQIFWIFAFLHR